MAAGPGGEDLTNVGGIYASVVVDTASTPSQLGEVYRVLAQLNGEFDRTSGSASKAGVAILSAAEATKSLRTETESNLREMASAYATIGAAVARTAAAELNADREIQRSNNEKIAQAIQGRQNQLVAEQTADQAALQAHLGVMEARSQSEAMEVSEANRLATRKGEHQTQVSLQVKLAAEKAASDRFRAEQSADQAALQAHLGMMEARSRSEAIEASESNRLATRKGEHQTQVSLQIKLSAEKAASDRLKADQAADQAALQSHLGMMESRSRSEQASVQAANELAVRKAKHQIDAAMDANAKEREAAEQNFIAIEAMVSKAIDIRETSNARSAASNQKYATDSATFYANMATSVDASDLRMVASKQRLADKQLNLKQIQSEYQSELARANSLTSDRAGKEEAYVQALIRSQSAHQALVGTVRPSTAAIEAAKQADLEAKLAADQLTQANTNLGGSYDRLTQLSNMAGGAQAALGQRSMAFTRLIYFGAQGLEDWAYGFRAVVNNIPLVANELGKLIGLTPQLSMGFAAVASIVGTVVANFDTLKAGYFGALYAGIPITKSAAAEMEELGKKTQKTSDEQARYNKLKEEQGRIDAILKIQSHEQDAQRESFTTAIKNAGGASPVLKSLAEIRTQSQLTQDPAMEAKIAGNKEAIAERKVDDTQKRWLQKGLRELEEKYSKQRSQKGMEIAQEDLRKAESDPQALEALIGMVKKNPGAFKPGLKEDLEHARPEQAVKDKIAGLDRDPFKVEKKAAAAAKKAKDDADSQLEKIADDLSKGFFNAWLKGVGVTAKDIGAAIEAVTQRDATPEEIKAVQDRIEAHRRSERTKKQAAIFEETGRMPTPDEAERSLANDLAKKEADAAERAKNAAERKELQPLGPKEALAAKARDKRKADAQREGKLAGYERAKDIQKKMKEDLRQGIDPSATDDMIFGEFKKQFIQQKIDEETANEMANAAVDFNRKKVNTSGTAAGALKGIRKAVFSDDPKPVIRKGRPSLKHKEPSAAKKEATERMMAIERAKQDAARAKIRQGIEARKKADAADSAAARARIQSSKVGTARKPVADASDASRELAPLNRDMAKSLAEISKNIADMARDAQVERYS